MPVIIYPTTLKYKNSNGQFQSATAIKGDSGAAITVQVEGSTPTIVCEDNHRYICGEVLSLNITPCEEGICDVVFTSGSTPTVLTVTPPTGMTMQWANGFDPTSLEANTTYKINIMDGCLGAAGQWNLDVKTDNKWEVFRTITLTEDSARIVVEADSGGQPFKAKAYVWLVDAMPSESTTQNTNAYVRVDPYHYVATLQSAVRTTETTFSGMVDVIVSSRSTSEGPLVAVNATLSNVTFYSNSNKDIPSDFKDYSDYFEIYTTGTAKFGQGTKLQLLIKRV